MADVMALHYGVLLYSRRLDANGQAPTVIERGRFLREQRERHPERAEVLDRRIAGNQRMQKILADPVQVAEHVGQAQALVGAQLLCRDNLAGLLSANPAVQGRGIRSVQRIVVASSSLSDAIRSALRDAAAVRAALRAPRLHRGRSHSRRPQHVRPTRNQVRRRPRLPERPAAGARPLRPRPGRRSPHR